ncbi:tetratricopeptide repeat protein [Comamonas sp. MYb21]|uniref:tetratricopeptide repeat protein n=2 Tax=unclassified Comamonas TaxID=2638500 RepID=UPI0030D716A2
MKLVSCLFSPLMPRAALLALALSCGAAYADEYTAVEKLIQSGQTALALEQLEPKIQQAPRDPQWRFLQGVAQMNAGQRDEATATFEKLVQEYPELPEPYNNLAVLYAQNNQLEKASRALQDAVRANPGYATAYENLGDIYIRLAEQSLSKASTLAPAQQARLQPKISSLRLLVTRAQPAAAAAPAAAAPAAPAAAPDAKK